MRTDYRKQFSAKREQQSHLPHVHYGIGKTISYALIGALSGSFGSTVAFTPYIQGAAGIAPGVFLTVRN
jgi:sulfite exporter TauE/SafE